MIGSGVNQGAAAHSGYVHEPAAAKSGNPINQVTGADHVSRCTIPGVTWPIFGDPARAHKG